MDMRALLEPKKHGKKKPKKDSARAPSDNAHPPNTPSANRSSGSIPVSPTTARTYDPRALLNPRGANASAKPQRMASQSGEADGAINDQNGTPNGRANSKSPSGFGFLETLHGAEKRVESRPAKKQKTDHETNGHDQQKDKSAQNSRHGNAGVGEYFKPEPEADGTSTSIPSTAIDLTLTDDDDDDSVQITGVRNIDDQEVCYGMIDASILAHKVPKPDKSNASRFATNQWPVFKVGLHRRPDKDGQKDMRIECTDPFNVMFGYIDGTMAAALAPAIDGFPRLRLQCRMLTRSQKNGEWPHQDCSDKYRVIMNLYGRRADVSKIGNWFGQANIWFKAPMVSDAGIPVLNPHAQRRAALVKTQTTYRVSATTSRTVEEATDAVSKLFNFQSEEGSQLAETEAPPSISTPLLTHQKQALTFMLRQEQPRTFASEEAGNSSLWRKTIDGRGRTIYREVVTGLEHHQEPPQSLGGLLADVMGLGKTIQALSLIVSTQIAANHFGQEQIVKAGNEENDLVVHSRATLLVAPVSTVKNWEDQIKEHTRSGSITFHVYHGSNRVRNPFELADNDVVITTYGTAAYEMFGKGRDQSQISPLLKVRWFRVVLDEAHSIRESKSSQARAMYSLHAQRRWCLTGTPIQNRMEDLGSLTTFLRLYPYDSSARFNQYIRGPMQSGDAEFLKKLRVMVDSFTLRRLRDQINLPNREDLTVTLKFSPEERALHDFFRDKFSVVVKEMSKDKEERKPVGNQFSRVLKGITILRLICDHGLELLKEEQLQEYEGHTAKAPIDVDEEAIKGPTGVTKKRAYEHFSQLVEVGLDNCVDCGDKFTGDSPAGEDVDSEAPQAIVLACLDVYCANCFRQYKQQMDQCKEMVRSVTCESCFETISPEYTPIPKLYAQELQTAPEEDTTLTKNNLFKNGQYNGPHTKTKALLADIQKMHEDSIPLVAAGEPPVKCVVFSEFTSHLDLIGHALTENKLTFVRIDGSMTLSNRRKVLDALSSDNSVTVLLASIKAAGQGLNLTAASRAFIMEPIWNPAAEAQAVDRIYRLGQNREVIVKRYRIENSMEDKIVQLQNKKKKLAEMSMEQQAMRKALGKKGRHDESLKEMLDIFKS